MGLLMGLGVEGKAGGQKGCTQFVAAAQIALVWMRSPAVFCIQHGCMQLACSCVFVGCGLAPSYRCTALLPRVRVASSWCCLWTSSACMYLSVCLMWVQISLRCLIDMCLCRSPQVPFVDVLSTMQDESIPLTIIEWEE